MLYTFYKRDIQKNLKDGKNIFDFCTWKLMRALCKYLLNISDEKINELEIPTGNPLIIEFDSNLKIKKYFYLDPDRAKSIIFNQ